MIKEQINFSEAGIGDAQKTPTKKTVLNFLESHARYLPFTINPERGIVRSFSDWAMRPGAQLLLDIGFSPNGATVFGGVINVGGQILALKSKEISQKIKESTKGWLDIAPTLIKRFGIGTHLVGLWFDGEDGAMTKLPGQKPTPLGAGLDNGFDRIGGSTTPTVIISSESSTPEEVEAAAFNQFVSAEVSKVRAIGEANGIKIREISFGSMLMRIPGMLGVLISEDHKAAWLNVVSTQAGLTLAERLYTIYRSGNKEVFQQAVNEILFDYGVYEITRVKAGRSLTRALITQGAAVGPSIYSKFKKVFGW